MNTPLLFAFLRFRDGVSDEAGQDLIEYAVIGSLMALAAIAGIPQVATAVGALFTSVSNVIA